LINKSSLTECRETSFVIPVFFNAALSFDALQSGIYFIRIASGSLGDFMVLLCDVVVKIEINALIKNFHVLVEFFLPG
jgi:hypothetical protein